MAVVLLSLLLLVLLLSLLTLLLLLLLLAVLLLLFLILLTALLGALLLSLLPCLLLILLALLLHRLRTGGSLPALLLLLGRHLDKIYFLANGHDQSIGLVHNLGEAFRLFSFSLSVFPLRLLFRPLFRTTGHSSHE
ncbi:MAG TPA: hypothetical protein DER60_13315 [Syntrophomonas sp.]|nr:hypothetical protein [Syntrophomonas sp.]